MGEIGVFTRILGAKYGAPFTYAGFNPERVFAAGMQPYQVLKKDYAYDRINAQTEIYGVIGDPIEQSLSPTIHNAGVRPPRAQQGHGAVPGPQRRAPRASSRSCSGWTSRGAASPSPTRRPSSRCCRTRRTPSNAPGPATRSSSRRRDAGSAITPTTAPRWTRSRRRWAAATAEEDASPLFEKQVLVLGAGGVARSIAFGLMRRGANVTITNRHDDRATRLAEEVGCRAITWAARVQHHGRRDHQLHAGRHASRTWTTRPCRRRRSAGPGLVVFDTIYHPENTMMLKLARERGLQDGHRRGHVPPPGGPPVQALHRAGCPDGRDARGAPPQALAAPRRMTGRSASAAPGGPGPGADRLSRDGQVDRGADPGRAARPAVLRRRPRDRGPRGPFDPRRSSPNRASRRSATGRSGPSPS